MVNDLATFFSDSSRSFIRTNEKPVRNVEEEEQPPLRVTQLTVSMLVDEFQNIAGSFSLNIGQLKEEDNRITKDYVIQILQKEDKNFFTSDTLEAVAASAKIDLKYMPALRTINSFAIENDSQGKVIYGYSSEFGNEKILIACEVDNTLIFIKFSV